MLVDLFLSILIDNHFNILDKNHCLTNHIYKILFNNQIEIYIYND